MAAFSLHPREVVLQAIYLLFILLVLPIHLYVLITQLTIMTISSVINHLDIEIYPGKFHKHFAGKWLIGANMIRCITNSLSTASVSILLFGINGRKQKALCTINYLKKKPMQTSQ